MGDSFLIQRLETRPDIPSSGRFLLPICCDREELLKIVSAVEHYRRVFDGYDAESLLPVIQALEYVGRPENALCYSGAYDPKSCVSFPAFANFIKYFPDDPYLDDEDVPLGYLTPAWWRWGNFESALPDFIDDWIGTNLDQFTGYQTNDAICWINSLLSLNILSWLGSGYAYPSIEIYVDGKGSIDIEFLSIPLGSRAIIEVDNPPNILDIFTGGVLDPAIFAVDTARDMLSFPPEKSPNLGFTIDIPEDGEHTVYIMFLPVVDPELSEDLVGFGGGIRSVQLCGGLRPRDFPESEPTPLPEGVEQLRPEIRFTSECGLEYRLLDQEDNIIEDWQPVAGWLENGHECFDGLNGVDGTDGVDGADGIDGTDGTDSNNNSQVVPPSIYQQDYGSIEYTSSMCQSSYYMADRIIELVAEIWEDLVGSTLSTIYQKYMTAGGFIIDMLEQVFMLYSGGTSVPEGAAEARDIIASWFFCGELNQEGVIANADNDTEIEDLLVRAVLQYAVRSVTQAKMNQWALAGSKDLAEQDCSNMCGFNVIFLLKADAEYTPEEGEIVVSGNTWSLETDADYNPAIGIFSTDGSAEIQKNLPADCRINDLVVAVRKHENCGQFRIKTWWRGLAGVDPEGYSPQGTVTSPDLVETLWNVHNAEMHEMRIQFSNNVCSGSGGDIERIEYIRMRGTGARPR